MVKRGGAATAVVCSVSVSDDRTTAAVQRYLDDLAEVGGGAQAEPVVRALLARAAGRLHLLCASLLFRSYPRLMKGPLNLQTEELLDGVIERLIKAMREVRPPTVRQFFALANQHMRWELNDLARRLDEQAPAFELRDSFAGGPAASSGSQLSPNALRILETIDTLPEQEREVFGLIRIQGMTHPEAAEVLGVSTKTVQRRLNRAIVLLSKQLEDLVGAVPADAGLPEPHG